MNFPNIFFCRWPEDCSKLANQFFEIGGFPSTAGVIDGCHINISPPKKDKLSFLNHHHSTSINVLAVAGPDLSFYFVDASAPGRSHDSKVLKESALWTSMEAGERPFPGGVLLGDSGYALRDWLITPFPGRDQIHLLRKSEYPCKVKNRHFKTFFVVQLCM
jgi:hypothetical protein